VVVTVPNEEELLKTKEKLDWREVKNYLFREPDLGGEATALATEPLDRKKRKYLCGYPLWKDRVCEAPCPRI
jgi:hypothetical protein